MEKAAASGFQKQKSESKSENDISMHASDKNLQKKVEDVQRYERYCPRVVSVFRSGERESERELKITKYQFKRWTFLVTAKESKDILKKKLEDIQTEITLKIANACCTVEYFSRQHEKNFESWVERCSKVTEACFRDLELLSVNGEVEAIQHLSKQIQKANEDHFISLFEMKGVSGIFLLGRGEHIIEVILASHAYFKNFIIQRPENNENIAYKVFDISSLQCRCMAAFNGIEQTKEKYPYLKVYQSGENVKMIGNENDCAAASEFLKTNGWMTGVQYGRCKQLICFEFFLKRVNVQAFIDGGITKYAGTWAVTKCTEPLNNELVFIYGKTRSDVEGILNVILESIKIKEISITSAACNEKNIQKWKAYAEKFEQSFGGKFSLQISTQKDPGLVAYFVFTADLEDEESLKILVNEIELEIPRKEKISVEPKHLIWLQKCYFDILKTEAKKNGIDLKFVSKNNVHQVEITGLSTALMEIKHLIHSICPKEQNILLPFASLPSKVTDFLRDSQCCFEYCPFKNSRLWIKGTTGIVVYKGEYGTDCLYSLLQVRALESEGKDMVIEWLNDEKTALLKFPLWREGGTREKNQIEEVLQLLFTEVKTQNKKYVAFDLQNLAFWPMKTCVKSIIDCVPKPPEGLIIWISHPDENAFQTAINCLKEAEFTKTGGDLKSSKIELKVVKGRIAKLQEKVDVIVNTTSLSLDMTSGAVSASILEAAGDELKTEIAQFPADRTTGQVIRVNYGDVAETFGYRLNCERIFHGALYKWKDDQEKARDVLRQFVKKCICLADERKFKTLAFPAIGTGQLKIPAVLVASSVKSIVEEYAASNDRKHVEKILFVIHEKDEENFKVFRTILEHENAGSTRETPEIPVLYRFSVYGEEHNVVGAMNVLAGLFREHVKEKYKLAMSQEEEKKDSNQQKSVQVQPVVKTNGYAISQSLATVSSTEKNKFPISYADQLCLLLRSKEKMILTEENLGPVLKDANYENIICPFLEEECALIKFKTPNDADKFFGSFVNEKYALRKLPIQAVTNLKAKLSSKIVNILKGKGITSEDFNRKTGACLSTDTWTVEGSLLMVQNGERLIKGLVVEEYEASNFSTQNENRSTTSLDSTQDIDLLRKYSIKCSLYEEKALRELFTSTELPFSNVNIVEVTAGQKTISGTQKNVNPFEKALAELKCQEISEMSLMEFQDFEKMISENVSVSFDEKRKAMIIISRSPELLKRSIEEFRRFQDDHLALTEEDFYLIIFFEKSLPQDFPKIDGKIMVKGPKSILNKYRLALDKLTKYPVQCISITDRVSSDAEIFISQFSRENKNVYIQMKDNKIFITGKKTDEVLLAKQRIDEQIEIMRKRNIGLASNGSDQNVKSGVPDVNLVSPKETELVFQKSNVRVYVLNANILQVKADAIVNPMSTDLSHSILREAGSSVQRECSEVLDLKRNSTLQIGETFVTDGGNLSHLLKIIHVNVPNWNSYAELKVGSPCEKCIGDIAETVKVSLEKGHDNNICTIAIPLISTCGVGSVPLPVCGRAYVLAVTSYIDAYRKSSTNKIREIYFVDTDRSKLDSIKFAFSGFQHWVFHQADNEEHFYHGGGTVVKIFASEILFADAEALVVPQDVEMKSERYIAKSLKKRKCEVYDKEIAKFYGSTWRVGDIRTTSAPKSLKFYQILHVYSPSWRSDVSSDVKIKDLRTCIQNVFKEASKLKLCTIAIPTFGGGITDYIDKQKVFKETARAIVECLGGTPGCTVRVISIIDSDELNIALMILQFYKILSQDGKLHNTDFIDVQRPYFQIKETEI